MFILHTHSHPCIRFVPFLPTDHEFAHQWSGNPFSWDPIHQHQGKPQRLLVKLLVNIFNTIQKRTRKLIEAQEENSARTKYVLNQESEQINLINSSIVPTPTSISAIDRFIRTTVVFRNCFLLLQKTIMVIILAKSITKASTLNVIIQNSVFLKMPSQFSFI